MAKAEKIKRYRVTGYVTAYVYATDPDSALEKLDASIPSSIELDYGNSSAELDDDDDWDDVSDDEKHYHTAQHRSSM